MSAPTASTMRAASAIVRGSEPKSWMASGCSSRRRGDTWRVFSLRCSIPAQLTISSRRAPPAAAPLAPKGLDADTCHGGEHEPRRDLDGADLPRFAKVEHGLRMVLAGCLTLLERGSYHSRPLSGPRAPQSRLWRAFFVKDVILTPEGYKQLKAELEVLTTQKRREIAERIAADASSARSPRTRNTTTRRTSR